MSKKTVYVDDKEGPKFRIVIKRLGKGATLTKMYAKGPSWSPAYRGSKILAVLDTGYGFKIKFYGPIPKIITLDFGQLADLRAVVEVLNRNSKHGFFDPIRISGTK